MVTKVTMTSKFLKMASRLNYEQVKEPNGCSKIAGSFRMVMAANMGTVGEYVYLWDKLL